MACARSAVVLALLLSLVHSTQALTNLMQEELKAFDQSGAMLNAEGYKAFLSAASTSARSRHDVERQSSLDALVAQDRSFDVQVSDDFAAKVDEEWDSVSLRELAKEHWEEMRPPAKSQQKAEAPKAPAEAPKPQADVPKPEAEAQAESAGERPGSLRNLLMSAGHARV
mmetsp:Transcript_34779/g.94195  ORF Transcript_34779/g.94195 Transcript_34779/m.94195 type:complete len:169 (-) Transcript_34779:51-557(-)|eukprot:CAMPEP_0171229556 /NCGR_PEP_ID=MMETSP0790-20130122/38941_1 /TAXON_ID=2925 /ORGANISM="Alexandrium catenella, Strain OF101" /LENGTH=168 /DNA_ID=CAMNT_0011695739 /DNA_START=110 /DNA_END=616 /DNA_ORIENTATION=+